VENFAIIGLGNPGLVYQKTRHNIGFWLLDAIAEKENLLFKSSNDFHADHLIMSRKNKRILLIKPKTFMNESGRYLSKILSYFRCTTENVVLIHDELTLPFGELKISHRRGAGGHNGVSSVFNFLGNSLIRFRIGIGSKPHPKMKLSDFVLSKFSSEECKLLDSKSETLIDTLYDLIDNGVDATMNLINQTKPSQLSS
jgi:peptidyl-tRNA hydrolase, PTH1 family